ncbi:MAG: hypothetical protein GOVbin287_57, partial [Prokaryotic dsDNA virus sp.]
MLTNKLRFSANIFFALHLDPTSGVLLQFGQDDEDSATTLCAAPALHAAATSAPPLPQVRFCPTGGVSPANAESYLSLPNVVC